MNTDQARRRIRSVGVVLSVALAAGVIQAQEGQVQWVSVKKGPVAVMLDPTPASVVVGLVSQGTPLRVRELRGDWYFVVLPKDEEELAARAGWILAALVVPAVAPVATPAPPAPMLERVVDPAGQSPLKPAEFEKPSPPQVSPQSWAQRFFVAINGARQESSLTFQDSRSDPFYGETRSWTADYAAKGANGFDIGGGVRLWRDLAAAVSVSRIENAKRTAQIGGEIPHPFWFERPRTISGESQALRHAERAVHVSGHWMLPPIARLRLAVFAGPSFFSVKRDFVEDVEFSESYPYDAASYERASVRDVSHHQRGFHAGTDVSWFLTRQIGVGAMVRYAHARAPLRSPATGRVVSIDVGGVQAGAGLRLRFGGWR